MEDIKVIFLDIDGVLNSYDWIMNHRYKPDYTKLLDDQALKVLHAVIKATGAKIVLSSSWRTNETKMSILNGKFKKFGLSIFSITTSIDKVKSRGLEIKSWLETNKNLYNVIDFVIIDDDALEIKNFRKTLFQHFVKTSFKDGLKEKHFEKICFVLNGGRVNLTSMTKEEEVEWKNDKFWHKKFIQETIND